jgi:hypothetical protein
VVVPSTPVDAYRKISSEKAMFRSLSPNATQDHKKLEMPVRYTYLTQNPFLCCRPSGATPSCWRGLPSNTCIQKIHREPIG